MTHDPAIDHFSDDELELMASVLEQDTSEMTFGQLLNAVREKREAVFDSLDREAMSPSDGDDGEISFEVVREYENISWAWDLITQKYQESERKNTKDQDQYA